MRLASLIRTFRSLQNITYCRFAHSRKLVLGIETSCDDTGAAVVDENKVILGEGCHSQMQIHLENGGVIPYIAVHFHQENIKSVVETALKNSNINLQVSIAVTTKPGLRGSLEVGIEYAMQLAHSSQIPLIPVHHMEAHALTACLFNDIPFPFLCLLASGGHCQLTLVKGINEFYLLGDSQHNSPGEVLDKIARRLKLLNLPECYEMSGGKAIEHMARGGDPTAFSVPLMLVHHRDCNFSFSGFSSFATFTIENEEEKIWYANLSAL
ncbi:probable tRNA N6-adenosine threonylcarbamoyltransferase, mitochondrial [Caerostris extrusa]|uniref:N(6)-L-threonylcarbamoyladenine synthase n=1 Tax=Caerostris extrusa TaxID=172846 RepID=A0AAV4RZQ8_CAEEX|nr:probable tRNA N6-adenosine threonylcarbamoyltransferase, mitochondrial [Caerostris extrusa]